MIHKNSVTHYNCTGCNSTHKQNLEYEASLLRQQMCAYQSCQLVLSQHFLMSNHSLFVARGSLRSDDKVNILNLRRGFSGELIHVSASVTVCVDYVISSHSLLSKT